MNDYDETLREALEENARLRSQHAESLREASSAQFSGRYRWAERIYWLYAIVCVVIGVSVINCFIRTDDTKSLIAYAVLLLVVYETTVLMKLWFAIAGMKMSVLKDVKLLRLEMVRLASAVGVKDPAEPLMEYEPMRGASRLERRLWLATCIIAAIVASTWSSSGFGFRGAQLSADSVITLAPDGRATSVTDITVTYDRLHPPRTFPFHLPKECQVRWIDPQGREMPYKVTPAGSHNRYDVTISENTLVGGVLHYTQIAQIPQAAELEDVAWTYNTDIVYSLPENRLKITVLLPPGAKVVSTKPKPSIEFHQEDHTGLRFQASRGMNEKFAYTIRYQLPSTTDDGRGGNQ